ncbi:hypothetical protein BLNAU_7420 [Blattamonas nauphoetae]|uniref:Uncharacterized protein n=1 Tax=Blattamonas nauphoetae TaxID=2049346 RepID=A0ABQ9Y1A1_9EUKA|nr:hypothetical protein BLNAU_7420 [Blattamonas nauphoetae]
MKMFGSLLLLCSAKVRFPLVKADLIPHLITTLNPQTFSFTKAVDIHACLMKIILGSLRLASPFGLTKLEIEDSAEQQVVHETVFQQVVTPSERYIRHSCVNRFSIVSGRQSLGFMFLLATLLEISPYYQPTMAIVLHMPIFITIPSYLTFIESEPSISHFLNEMNKTQLRWNDKGGEVREMGKTVLRMLRMEGIEDVTERKLRNDRSQTRGRDIVDQSIEWNNQQGMNLSRQE